MNNLVLIGFPGSGKDSIGKEIAKKTDLIYFSTDNYISLKEKMNINRIFENFGENYFRKREQKALRRINNLNNIVVSTGGGMPVHFKNSNLLKGLGKVIKLDCKLSDIIKRIRNTESRPLIKDMESLKQLFEERKNAYDFADFEVNVSNKSIQDIADFIIKKLELKPKQRAHLHKVINIKTKQKKYPVYIGVNIVERINEYIKKSNRNPNKIIVISDALVSELYFDDLKGNLNNEYDILHFIIKEGERNKNLNTVKEIYDYLLENRVNRNDLLISLGGGIVGDITGFVASTFKRGIGYVQIPTTLLSQVDASVGGKTGINHKQGKNMIGSFYQPDMVIINVSYLKTLPDKIYNSGISEIIKYGIISDNNLFSLLEKKRDEIIKREDEVLLKIIESSIAIKGKIVEEDENEDCGVRELLNFGHTIGHIIEKEAKYKKISHGEAVAIGMVEESRIAKQKGYLDKNDFERIKSLIDFYELPVVIPKNLTKENIINSLSQDKKVRSNRLILPMPIKIGESKIKEVLCKEYL